MGRTRIVYCTGPFEPAPPRPPRTNRSSRPADPHEALTGTVTDFVLMEEEAPALDHISMGARPHPQPRAAEPIAEQQPAGDDTSQGDVASSFWYRQGDANRSQRDRDRRHTARHRSRAPASPGQADLSRDSATRGKRYGPVAPGGRGIDRVEEVIVSPVPSRRQRLLATATITLAGIAVTGIAMASIWLLTLGE